jgi:hypothetical protein
MAAVKWVSDTSGNWDTVSNWGSALPTAADIVTIDFANITVSITSGGAPAVAYSLTSSATMDIIGGTLTTVASASFSGAFDESSGTFTAGGRGATFSTNADVNLTGGVMDATAGATLNMGGLLNVLAGALTGAGTLLLATNGSSTYFDTGFTDTQSTILVEGGAKLGVQTNFTFAGNLIEGSNDVIDIFPSSTSLAPSTLTLTGNDTILGVLGDGTLEQFGTLTLGATNDGATTLDDGLQATINGLVNQNGSVNYGSGEAGAKVTIAKTGQYLINGNWVIGDPSSVGSISNAGVFEKAAGGREAIIYTSFSSTNTIKVNIGELALAGAYNTISGIVSGAGTLALIGGTTTFGTNLKLQSTGFALQGGVLVLNKALSYRGEWDMTGGVLNLNSTASTLTLTRLEMSGGTITGYGGTVLLDNAELGGGNVTIGGPNTLTLTGTLDQTASITLGASSNPTVDIDAGAVWSIEANSGIIGFYGVVYNEGLLIDPNGSGIAFIQSELISAGTLTVNNSVLQLEGIISELSGKISGTGMLDLASTAILESGVAVTVRALEVNNASVTIDGTLNYAGAFSEIGGSATLSVQNVNLTGPVSLDAGFIIGNGTITSSGLTTIGNINITDESFEVTTKADQTGGLNLIGGTLVIASGATYKLDDDYSITGSGVVVNEGTLISNGTASSDTIQVAYEQTGLLTVYNSALQLNGGGVLGGTIAGPHGTVQLTAGAFTLSSGLDLTLAELEVSNQTQVALAASLTYGGYFNDSGNTSTLALSGDTLSLTGTTQLLNTTLIGGGAVDVTNTATLSGVTVGTNTVLALGASADLAPIGAIVIDGTLAVGAGTIFSIEDGTNIFGPGVLSVAGTLSAASDGTGTISSLIANAGMISAALGTLSLTGTLTGSGAYNVGSAAVLVISGEALGTNKFNIANTGVIELTNTSTVTAANSVIFATGNGGAGDLILGNTLTFGAEIAGFTAGDMIELPGFGSTSKGTLSSNGETFTVTTLAATRPFLYSRPRRPRIRSMSARQRRTATSLCFTTKLP